MEHINDNLNEIVENEISVGKCMYKIALENGDKDALLCFINDIKKRYADKGDVIEYEMIRNGLIKWIENH